MKKIETWVDNTFPGIGFRSFWITIVSTISLTVYWHWGSPQGAPYAFILSVADVLDIKNFAFYQHLWSHTVALVVLLAIPLLISWYAGISPRSLGFTIKNVKREFILIFVIWIVLLPLIYLHSQTTSFQNMYPRLSQAGTDVSLFIFYELFYLSKWIAWEFFFRGFMLLGLKTEMGNKAVLISTIPFVLMHFGKPELEVYASLVLGLLFCWLTLRTMSIWPAVFLHWFIAISMDFFTSSWWK